MRSVRTLALAGAASLVLFASLGVVAGPATADAPGGPGTPVPGEVITATEPDVGVVVTDTPDGPDTADTPDTADAPDTTTTPDGADEPSTVPTVLATPPTVSADPAGTAVGGPGSVGVPGGGRIENRSAAAYEEVLPDPPEIDDRPEITGTARFGETLHVSDGDWFGDPPFTFTYQWQHCDDDPCTDIAGADDADYTLVATDIDHRIGAVVTAHNDGGDSPAGSNWTDEVEGILPTGPSPVIAGIARVGETLTATVGPWSGHGDLTTTWMWGRCGGLYACDTVEGATSPAYTITADDLGMILVARVVVSSAVGTDGAPSAPTAEVVAAPAAGRDSNVTSDGNTITVSGSGFAPDSDVTVVLHSDPVVLGIAHTDAAGNFTATFAIPAIVPAGDHTLVFTGVDAAGNPVTVEQAVTIGARTPAPAAPPARVAMLPVTGSAALTLTLAAGGLLFAGAMALLAARRQTAPVR